MVMNIFKHDFDRHRPMWIACALILAAIAVIEVVPCNLPFWTSFGASTDSVSAVNPLGSGLRRQDDGTLTVTDPTNAYMEVTADGSSPFVRLEATTPPLHKHRTKTELDSDNMPQTYVHVRLDTGGASQAGQSVDTRVAHSLYLRSPGHAATLRLWIQEPKGTAIAISAMRANVRVPFRFDVWRFVVMAAFAMLLIAFRPHAALWNTRLDTGSRPQRLAFAGFAICNAILMSTVVISSIRSASPGVFHEPRGYTYDFNQYGHLADSLIQGRTWLDLPQSDALATVANPYDPAVREMMLAKGEGPMYWDYVYRSGHWYSYFGVLPALFLFVPYRLITAIFVPGGLMLPAQAATAVLLFAFIICGSLLIIRIISRTVPHASLASTILALTLFLLGSNTGYLSFRMNFYSIPFAASLAVSALGLWFWIGATMSHTRHAVTIGNSDPLSWPHLMAGSCFIAANFGCRPTFTLVALLAFVLFGPQLRQLRNLRSMRRSDRRAAMVVLCSIIIPALIVVAPLTLYNMLRFGSAVDFGERYQITVADMMHHHMATMNLLPSIGYYLFLPLRTSPDFPFLSINPTPLPTWNYNEPMIGGLIALCPALLLAACMALPRVRRIMNDSTIRPTVTAMLPLALALLVFDSLKGGLGWRYMVDFGWLIAIPASTALAAITRCGKEHSVDRHETLVEQEPLFAHVIAGIQHLGGSIRYPLRLIATLLIVFSLIVDLLCMFVPGREDALTRTNPALYQSVASWFKL